VRHLVDREAEAEGLGDRQDAVGRRPRQGADDGRLVGRALISISFRPVSPVSMERNAFCSDSWKVRPIDMASPTLFIEVVSNASAPGNFSKAKRGILGDDIVDRRLERGGRRAGDVVQ